MRVLIALLTILLLTSDFAWAEEIDTTKAVIHHTASPDWNVARFREIHINERGWNDVGYHYIIRKDGTIEKGRSISEIGAHAKGRNHYIGIALTGYDKFTSNQLNNLIQLLRKLGVTCIERHHKECPSQGLDVEGIQEKLYGKE